MTFERIAIVDPLGIDAETLDNLKACSKEPIELPESDPVSETDVAQAVSGADALLVSWRTKISRSLLKENPQIRYIGLCASPFAQRSQCNVDLDAASESGIVVSALGQYGDEATAEWVIASMLNAVHHIGPLKWQERRRELHGKRLAIIGLGAVGWDVAFRAKALGMDVVYTARAQKPGASAVGLRHVSMQEAMATADIVSVHIAKGVEIMGSEEFDLLRAGVLLINTSIGTILNPAAFEKWLASGSGYCIGDATVDPALAELMRRFDNAFLSDQPAADTVEMQQRKCQQLLGNVHAFLDGAPIRTV